MYDDDDIYSKTVVISQGEGTNEGKYTVVAFDNGCGESFGYGYITPTIEMAEAYAFGMMNFEEPDTLVYRF